MVVVFISLYAVRLSFMQCCFPALQIISDDDDGDDDDDDRINLGSTRKAEMLSHYEYSLNTLRLSFVCLFVCLILLLDLEIHRVAVEKEK